MPSYRTGIALRHRPGSADGGMWALAGRSGLDVNSPHQYLLWCRDFAATSVVARRAGAVVGFVTGYRRPDEGDVLFVWQVAVDPAWGRRGLGARMVRAVAGRPAPPAAGGPGTGPARWVEATVTPGNVASDRPFRQLAADAGAGVATAPLFPAEAFPVGRDAEVLYRVGPLASAPRDPADRGAGGQERALRRQP